MKCFRRGCTEPPTERITIIAMGTTATPKRTVMLCSTCKRQLENSNIIRNDVVKLY